MTFELITKAQEGDGDSTLLLIEKFNPLLKKYAHKLYCEDAYNELLLNFIEMIHNIQLDHIHVTSEGAMVSYVCKSIHSSFIKELIAIKKLRSLILYSELSDTELYYVDVISSTYDEYFRHGLPDISLVLTKSEMEIIKMVYYTGYKVAEVAVICGISRQAVNQMKKRALKKLEFLFLDKPYRKVKI